MRREAATIGHKTINYLITDHPTAAVRQRPPSTIVFLHAFPLQPAMWETTLAVLPEGWRGVAPEMRWASSVKMTDLAGDVIDLLDHLAVTQAVMCGCSMGGYVAFELLKSAPRYLSALVLVSTRPGADNEEGRRNRQKMMEQVDREGVEAIATQMVPKLLGATTQRERPDMIAQVRNMVVANTPDRVKAAVAAMMDRNDSTSLLAGVDVPVLIVHGSEDTLIPPAEAEGMHRAIRNSQLELIPASGHLPNLEQPEAVHLALSRFLKKL
jgi:3-oxoadipate enol-lactonase